MPAFFRPTAGMPLAWGLVCCLGLLALLAPQLAGGGIASDAPLIVLREADALLQPLGLPPEKRRVALRHRWANDFPERAGRADYRLQLPEIPRGESMGMLLEATGNQVLVHLNGVEVLRLGVLGDPGFDAVKACHLVTLPAPLFRATGENFLQIAVTTQALRSGGLGAVSLGPLSAVIPVYAGKRFWGHQMPIIYAISLAVMGLLCAALWWRQRDRLYGCFSVAALAGVVRIADQVWLAVPFPWPFWGMLVAACYALHLLYVVRFVLLALDRLTPFLDRAIDAALGGVLILIVFSFGFDKRHLWTAGLVILLAIGCAGLGASIVDLIRRRRPIAWILTSAGGVAVFCGIHDLLFVRIGVADSAHFPLMPHASFFFVLILGGIVVNNYSRSLEAYRALSDTLADQVAERERQLGEAFEALRRQRETQALLSERQRIMRDLHDGVGSQLVGMLNLLEHGALDRSLLTEHVQGALDEMRIAVDALQPVGNDLGVVLGNLRYRLQPRLAAAGLAVDWQVMPLPPLLDLSPQVVLHLQRIVLEALTNVLKHAGASRVRIATHWRAANATIYLEINDDGCGLAPETDDGATFRHGCGLAGMRLRAEAIGARLSIASRPGHGVHLLLEWPGHAEPAAAS